MIALLAAMLASRSLGHRPEEFPLKHLVFLLLLALAAPAMLQANDRQACLKQAREQARDGYRTCRKMTKGKARQDCNRRIRENHRSTRAACPK